MGAGPEILLGNDDLEVVLLPRLGARIHRIRAFGRDLLRTPPDPDIHATDPFFWGAYPMAPWCNRAPAGRRRLRGRELDLAANFEDGSAIHGLVHAEPWELAAEGTSLAIRCGGPGHPWPWAFELTLVAAVEERTLRLDYRLANRAESPMPAGIGLHPWFRRPLEVRVPAERVYRTNLDSAREPEAAAGRYDLTTLAPPAEGLDATWTGLAAARVDLSWPQDGMRAALAMRTGSLAPLVAVASPPAIEAIAVEPQTHGPDPIRRLEGGEPNAPTMLDPGGELRLELSLTIARA